MDTIENPETGSAAAAARTIESFRRLFAYLPEPCAFSHASAALIHGWPLPWAVRVMPDADVMRPSKAPQIRRAGVFGHRGLELRSVVTVGGLPVTGLADTWVDLGEYVGSGKPFGFEDIIAAGDQALNAGISVAELRTVIESRIRPRGKLTLLDALAHLRRGSESAMETRFRLVVIRAGLPEPELNVPVYGRDRTFSGRPDLSWRAKRVAVEYQGTEFHSAPAQVAADEVRFESFAHNDWETLDIDSRHIFEKPFRDGALTWIAEHIGFPVERLNLEGAAPTFFSPSTAEAIVTQRARRGFRMW